MYSTYDAIVLGTGGVGSAALFHLARRGFRVLGLDRFPGAHDRGSSHGQTRIIRKAYFEHPDYVPLLHRAYDLWFELENLEGQSLYRNVGLVQIGPPHGAVIEGVLKSAKLHNLPIETWDALESARRLPGFHIPGEYLTVFEQQAGFLYVERCVRAHLSAAQNAGAEIRTEPVIDWHFHENHVTVRTEENAYSAAKLVITAGAWASQMIAGLGISFRVLRKHLHWFRAVDRHFDCDAGCPTFLYDLPQGCFYGFPSIDGQTIKVAEHSGGTEIQDPLRDARQPEPIDLARVKQFVADYLPGISTQQTDHAVCFYTMSPDHHFLVDRHPEFSNVVFAAGLSGHGFKFTTVIGEVLADLAQFGTTQLSTRFLGMSRFTR